MNKISIDTFTKICANKEISDDYIISGSSPVPYIILSDGCSMNKGTNIGSMILCNIAKRYFIENQNFTIINNDNKLLMMKDILNKSITSIKTLGIEDLSCLSSTLFISYIYNNKIYILLAGDGIILIEDSDGKNSIFDFEFNLNYPFYINYLINEECFEDFCNLTDPETKEKNSLYIKHYFDIKNNEYKLLEPKDNSNITLFEFDINDLNKISICSDGIKYIKNDSNINCNKYDFIKNLYDFKTTAGVFLKRSCFSLFESLEKKSFKNYDDISIGTFLIE